ncbi:MAG: membrane dipeptidase [Gemmatimonadetes bacterium]|nr:membrane dipeptidase [Gemmatimonadota bacterium]
MRRLAAFLLLVATAAPAQTPDPYLARVKKLLATTPIIDGHNDVPWEIRENAEMPRDVDHFDLRTNLKKQDTDLPRLKAGGVGGQFWSIYIPGEVKDSGYARIQLEQFDIARRMIAKYDKEMVFAKTAADAKRAFAAGKFPSFLGMEGGHAIENSLGALRIYYELGARYMTLTHNVTLDWADAALDKPTHGGLTPFGKEVVREMNRMGMIVDLSHVSPAVMSDALNVTESPVMFSHSSARALADHPRDVPDSILVRVKKNGGVVMVTFVREFVSQKHLNWRTARDVRRRELTASFGGDTARVRAAMTEWLAANPEPVVTLSDVADHFDHYKKIMGADHVGIGGDFDGVGGEHIAGLEDVSTYPALLAELARRGWTDDELRKVASGNILRVLAENEKVAARLQKTRKPSTKTIDELDRGPKM